MENLCHKLEVIHVSESTPSVMLDESVRAVRPYIVCCIVSGISFVQHTFKKFIQLQVILNIINPWLSDLTGQGGWVAKVDKSVVMGLLPIPGVHKYCKTKFCTVVPSILSTVIAVIFALAFKHVYQFTGIEYKVPDNRLTCHSRIVGPQYGICFMSAFWHLGFGAGSYIFRKSVGACSLTCRCLVGNPSN